MNSEYVQYGCGWCAPESWLNFDSSPTLRYERLPVIGNLYTRNARRFPSNVRFGDIVKGLPITEGQCRAIYCSHVLEHLALNNLDSALANTRRYLKPGGIFRLVVPDLRAMARAYVEGDDPYAAFRFVEATGLGRKLRAGNLPGMICDWLGNSAHNWMWDEKGMMQKLGEHDFRQIRAAKCGDSEDPLFGEVEDPGRFEGSVALQCVK